MESGTSPGGSGGLFSRLRNWKHFTPKKVSIFVGVFVGLILVSILLGIGLTLYELSGSSLNKASVEIYDVCGTSNPFKVVASFENPSTTGATINKVNLKIKTQSGVLVASSILPSFDMKTGKSDVSIESDITFEDEEEISRIINSWVRNEVQVLTLESDVELNAMGFDLSTTLSSVFVIGVPYPTESSYELSSATIANNSDILRLDLNMKVNSTNPDFIVHMPNLLLNVLHNDTFIASAESLPLTVVGGWNDLFATVLFSSEDMDEIEKVLNSYIDGNETLIVLEGQDIDSECAMQRILSRVSIEADISSSGDESGLEFETMRMKSVSDSVDMSADFNTSSSTEIYGDVPSIQIIAKDENGNVLVTVDLELILFPDYTTNFTVYVNRTDLIAGIFQKIVDGGDVSVTITGSPSSSDFLSTLLSRMEWTFSKSFGSDDSNSSDIFSISYVKLLGSPPEGGARFSIDFFLDAGFFEGVIPSVVLLIEDTIGNSLISIHSHELPIVKGQLEYRFIVDVKVEDLSQVQSTVDQIFEGNVFLINARGDTLFNDHVIQRILNEFRTNFTVNTTQSEDGASSVQNGIMPQVDIVIVDSYPELLTVQVSLAVDFPMDFPVDIGDIYIEGSYLGFPFVNASWNGAKIFPANNNISVLVSLMGGDNRNILEFFLSDYLFGSSIPGLSLDGVIDGPDFLAPVGITYDFDLPASSGGGDTEVIKCVEMTSMDYSVWDIILPWRSCELTCLVDSYFHNPLPFDMTLISLSFQVDFDDLDGFLCAGSLCVYDPRNNVHFATVIEPGPIPPEQNPLPLNLVPDQTGKTVLRFNGASNELCFRLYDEYEYDQLTLDITNGQAVIGIGDFHVTISFEWYDYLITQNSPPCIEVI